MKQEKIILNQRFEELTRRIRVFYSFDDLDEIAIENGIEAEGILNLNITDLLTLRQEYFETKLNAITEDFEDEVYINSKLGQLKLEANNNLKANKEALFTSTLNFPAKTLQEMHIYLGVFINYLDYKLTFKEDAIPTVGHRGQNIKSMEIMQKIILTHFLTENKLFPERDLSQSPDKYIQALAKLFTNSGTNIEKKAIAFRKVLKEFKVQRNRVTFDEFSPSINKHIKVVKAWLKDVGLDNIIQNIDVELDLI